MLHPRLGPLLLDCDTLLVPDDQSVVVHSAAAGTPEAGALSLLTVVGTQMLLPADLVDHPQSAAVAARPAR